MKKIQLVAALFVVALMCQACFADQYSETLITSANSNLGGFAGLTFTANLYTTPNSATSGTFTLDLFVTDTSSTKNATLTDFTISLLGGGSNPSVSATGPNTLPNSSWSELDNAKITTNGVGCSQQGSGYGGWLCASGATPLTLSSNGGLFEFVFQGSYSGGGVSTPFDLWANGTIGSDKYQVSNNMTANSVPEPSSIVLLVSGFSGLGLRRWLRKSKVH